MRGIAQKEKPAVLHRLRHEAAHLRHAALSDRAIPQREPLPAQPRLQLRPDAVVGPGGQVLVRFALQIQPADHRRAHRQQREATLMAGIDQLLGGRRRVGEDAQPAERIGALETGQ
jgi:hypothetical protein